MLTLAAGPQWEKTGLNKYNLEKDVALGKTGTCINPELQWKPTCWPGCFLSLTASLLSTNSCATSWQSNSERALSYIKMKKWQNLCLILCWYEVTHIGLHLHQRTCGYSAADKGRQHHPLGNLLQDLVLVYMQSPGTVSESRRLAGWIFKAQYSEDSR